jgi:hypothetical protein
LALIVLEFALRILQAGPLVKLQPQVRHIYVPRDLTVGRHSDYFYLAPRQTAYHFNVSVSTNSLGIRNPEIQLDKADSQYRILALGDSHTFGFAVEEWETWPRLLEQKLKHSDDWRNRNFDVINGGVAALSLEQEIEFLRERLLRVKPDLVIVGYYWNDMPMGGDPFAPLVESEENTETLSSSDDAENRDRDEAKGKRSGVLKRVEDNIRCALRESYLIYSLVQRIPYLQMIFFPTVETKWKRGILEGKTSSRIEASWSSVRTELIKLKQLGEKSKFELVVLIIPLFEQMISSGFPQAIYQSKLTQICKEIGVQTIDPLAAIRAIQPSYPDHFIPFDGHPNGRVYEVIAEEVFGFLQKNPFSFGIP